MNGKASIRLDEPIVEPARSIFRALVAEQALRPNRSQEVWLQAEREAVYRAAQSACAQMQLPAPTMALVEMVEKAVAKTPNYESSWALRLAWLLTRSRATVIHARPDTQTVTERSSTP